MNILNEIISNLLICFIFALRSLLPSCNCKYTISCTIFAQNELKTKSLLCAIYNITKRTLSCNPFN